MPEPTLDTLERLFPEAVAAMPEEFDSHQFILWLAQHHQGAYVRALAAYAHTDQPFKNVHGQIAKRLHGHPSLVAKVGEGSSRDIFGERCSAAKWRKVR